MIDIGTASGFLAFSAEEHGASKVVAFDNESLFFQDRIPFAGELAFEDKPKWAWDEDFNQNRMLNSFWYIWHKKKSKVEVVYGSLNGFFYTK